MDNLFTPAKYAQGSLIGASKNTFDVLGCFSRLANESGWSKDEINVVASRVMKSNSFDEALSVMANHVDSHAKGLLTIISKEDGESLLDDIRVVCDKHYKEKGHYDTKHGEIARAVNRLNYEFFNNGIYYIQQDNSCGSIAEYLIDTVGGKLALILEHYGDCPTFNEEEYKLLLRNVSKLVVEYFATTEDEPNSINFIKAYTGRWDYSTCDECGSIVENPAFCCSDSEW